MDYIRDGSKILLKFLDQFDFDEIKDLKVFDSFMAQLLEASKGLLIVDFLDAGNWDHFGSYSID